MAELIDERGPRTPAPGRRTESTSSRREAIRAELCAMAAELLQADVSDVDPSADLLEIGADSIVLVEAVRILEASYGVEIKIRQLFEELSTIDKLADYLDRELPREMAPPSSRARVPQAQRPARVESPQRPAPPPPERRNGNGALEMGSELEGIFADQLALLDRTIAKQLDVLHGLSDGSRRRISSPARGSDRLASRTEPLPAPPVADVAARGGPAPAPGATRSPWARSGRPPAERESDHPTDAETGAVRIAPQRQSDRQRRHLAALIERYGARTPGSKDLARRQRPVLADRRSVMGFRPSMKELLYPIAASRSFGSRFWDVDGNEYVDLTMGFGTAFFGHGADFILDAVRAQLDKRIPIGPQSELAGTVARLICELTGMERVTFCVSGSDAVMAALRLARTRTGRTKIALFDGSYHGLYDATLVTAAARSTSGRSVPAVPGIPQGVADDVLVLEYGAPAALETLRCHGEELAAVLVEPVQSRRPALQPREFLQELRSLTREIGAALIFDEILTGFRIHPGGAQGWFDVRADLATYGKIIGGGLPIGVVAGDAAYLDAVDGGQWSYGDGSYPTADLTLLGSTYVKHALAMAAAHAVLVRLKAEGAALQQQVNRRTGDLAAALNGYFAEEKLPMRLEHCGSIFRFAVPAQLELFYYHLIEKGVYIWEGRSCCLSLAHSADDNRRVSSAVQETVEELRDGDFLPPRAVAPARRVAAPMAASDRDSGGDGSRRLPLTEGQQRLCLLAEMGPEASVAYNESVLLRLRGALDVSAFEDAFREVIHRHDALRAGVDEQREFQIVQPRVPFAVTVLDLSTVADDEREENLREWLEADARTPFDLSQPPLLRVQLARLSAAEHRLLVTGHHSVVDGWSLGVVLREVIALYAGHRSGASAHLDEPLQLGDYLRWYTERVQSETVAAAEPYWLRQIGSPPALCDLPTDLPRPPVKSYSGGREHMRIDRSLGARLKRIGAGCGCTPFMTLLAGFCALLHRLTGQEDLLIGVPTALRNLKRGESLVANCVNFVAIRSRAPAGTSFEELLRSVRTSLLEALERNEYPFATLIRRINPPRDLSRPPLLTVGFSMDPPSSTPNLADLDVELLNYPIGRGRLDLLVNSLEIDGEFRLDVDYSSDLFLPDTIRRWLAYLENLLRAAVEEPQAAVSRLHILSPAELHRVTVEWNDTAAPYLRDATLHGLVEAQARRTPDAVALVAETGSLTYRELDERGNRVARAVRALGASPDAVVAVCMERSLELVVGLLGVLKAGACYLPLDPDHPQERLATILAESNARIILAQSGLRNRLPPHAARLVEIDADWEAIALHPEDAPASAVTADHLAYVIYTSGSTGTPKGAMNEHGAICNRLLWMQEAYGLGADDCVFQKTPFSFDVSVWEFFWPLIAGARLAVARPGGHQDPAYLVQAIQRHGVTTIHFVPAMLQSFLEEPGVERCTSLRRVICSGESLPADLRDRFFELSGAELCNLYGPTEAAVDVTHWTCERGSRSRLVPIGRPIANTRIHLLDSELQPVPVGVTGELFVGGRAVGRGYLNRADLTAKSFIPDPFAARDGARLYRTGDLARYRSDGAIEYLGRIDSQVKLRGCRIELGEVEAALAAHPEVRESVVAVDGSGLSDKRLIAYFVPMTPGFPPDLAQLQSFLKQRLPDYMCPSYYVPLDELPLTANGKVDRRALPAPELLQPLRPADYAPPQSELENTIASAWAETLELDRVGVHDNFFDLGGHSLLLARVRNHLRRSLGRDLSMLEMFTYPTVDSLARYLGAAPEAQNEAADRLSALEAGRLRRKDRLSRRAEVQREERP